VHDLREIRELVDDLALRLAAGIGDAELAPDVERVRAAAERHKADAVAEAAGNLLAAMRRGPSAVAEGLGLLQQAFKSEPRNGAGNEKPPAQDPELLSDFIVESREHLANIETEVMNLERDASDSEALHSVFRGFHTIKGLAGFLELWEVQKLSHEVETVLDLARNSELVITPVGVDVILQSADYLARWLAHLEAELQNVPSAAPVRDEQLLARIRALSAAKDFLAGRAPTEGFTAATDLASMASAVDTRQDQGGEQATARAERRSEAMTIKVDTAKLDYLVDMAGEMVIAESLVRHDPDLTALKSPGLQRNLSQLTRITAELQKTAMAIRLVPIGPLFRRMARLVRDLSRQFGKRVEMETQGEEIELDRTIVEELADPLMHMVRNAMDHGIETPDERKKRGKSVCARLLLKAQHQAGQVVIELSDDGRGLDREKIAAKGIERGLISSAEGMSDCEIYNLIFEPGFSTAAQVTNVSGRGVGMDVVRKHIEKLRGRIDVRSVLGQGATFLLKVPLTLAIIDGLVVGVGEERYIVPVFAVREMFRPGEDTMWTVQQKAEMALVRGDLLPVTRLYRRFRVPPRSEDPQKSVLVIAEVEGQRFGLMVDEVIGKQEVVIKSLGEVFKNVPGIAGGAILGDGRVGLILDLDRLFRDGGGDAGH
jgi:two-component system chemotaxis sensor kinase CheA